MRAGKMDYYALLRDSLDRNNVRLACHMLHGTQSIKEMIEEYCCIPHQPEPHLQFEVTFLWWGNRLLCKCFFFNKLQPARNDEFIHPAYVQSKSNGNRHHGGRTAGPFQRIKHLLHLLVPNGSTPTLTLAGAFGLTGAPSHYHTSHRWILHTNRLVVYGDYEDTNQSISWADWIRNSGKLQLSTKSIPHISTNIRVNWWTLELYFQSLCPNRE